ncbi:MAG: substrate-binding domain-containing protein [Bacteroidetes bacterium]|nr:substrate-binding domain-containing protein [Bacteroidota bacterium]
MKTRLTFFILSLVFILAGCNSKTGKKETIVLSHSDIITISGAYALSPIVSIWIAEFQKTHPYVKFKLNPNGSGGGLKDILSGKVDLAMISEKLPKGSDTALWVVPVARVGVVPIISGKNPYLDQIMKKGMTKEILNGLFSGKTEKTWGDLYGRPGKDPVKLYKRGDTSGAATVFAKYLSLSRDQVKGTAVSGEHQLIAEVEKDPLALSYCNFIYAFDPATKKFLDDLKVLPIDFWGKGTFEGKDNIFGTYDHLQRAMWLGKYPNALIRDLSLVTKGKPRTKEMVEFLYWIVTDGQKFLADNGYTELHSSDIQSIATEMKAMIP